MIEIHAKRRRYVRRRIDDSLKYRYVTKTVKYGGFSILMCGAIKGDGTRVLVRCPNSLDSKEYQSVLSQGLFQVYYSSNISMQGNATCHKSFCTMQYLEKGKVCVIDD